MHKILLPIILVFNLVVPLAGLEYTFDGHMFYADGALHTPCHQLVFDVTIIDELNWENKKIKAAYITIDAIPPETACQQIFTPFHREVELDVDKLSVNGQGIWRFP